MQHLQRVRIANRQVRPYALAYTACAQHLLRGVVKHCIHALNHGMYIPTVCITPNHQPPTPSDKWFYLGGFGVWGLGGRGFYLGLLFRYGALVYQPATTETPPAGGGSARKRSESHGDA